MSDTVYVTVYLNLHNNFVKPGTILHMTKLELSDIHSHISGKFQSGFEPCLTLELKLNHKALLLLLLHMTLIKYTCLVSLQSMCSWAAALFALWCGPPHCSSWQLGSEGEELVRHQPAPDQGS